MLLIIFIIVFLLFACASIWSILMMSSIGSGAFDTCACGEWDLSMFVKNEAVSYVGNDPHYVHQKYRCYPYSEEIV